MVEHEVKQDSIEYKRQQMLLNFKVCFNTPEGRIVLNALKSEYYDNCPTIDPNEALVYNAERGVIQHIMDLVEQVDG